MYIKSLIEAAKENGYSDFDLYLLKQQITTNTKLSDTDQKLLYKKLSELQPKNGPEVGVFFTGHRPSDLWGYENMQQYKKLFSRFVEILNGLKNKHGNIVVYVGGAQGVDMIAQEASVALGIKTILCRPSAEYNRKWKDDGGFFSKEAFEARTSDAIAKGILTQIIVSEKEYEEDSSILEVRNMYMSNHSHICVACKIPQKMAGGTYNAWRYAKNAGLKVIQVDPFEGENQNIPVPFNSAEKEFLDKFPHFPNRSTEGEKHCLLPFASARASVSDPATSDTSAFVIID